MKINDGKEYRTDKSRIILSSTVHQGNLTSYDKTVNIWLRQQDQIFLTGSPGPNRAAAASAGTVPAKLTSTSPHLSTQYTPRLTHPSCYQRRTTNHAPDRAPGIRLPQGPLNKQTPDTSRSFVHDASVYERLGHILMGNFGNMLQQPLLPADATDAVNNCPIPGGACTAPRTKDLLPFSPSTQLIQPPHPCSFSGPTRPYA